MKAKLSYTVRSTRAPGETRDSIVPVIVERLNPVELETVVENCIDRGLIAGLKPTAAHGIAEGVAAQIAREFTLGRGVQFGQYFYGRPYLSGTVDANGRLTSANGVNVRLYKGAAFKLTLDDFTLSFDGAGDSVKVDSVYGDTDGAGGNTYGQLVENAPVKINGRNLYAAGDTDKVTFSEVDGTATVEVSDFATQGADMLSFAWPSGLEVGKRYGVTVERTDVNGVTRTATGKYVDVVAGETPPVPPPPPPTGPTVTAIDGGEFHDGTNVVTGANMRFADAYPAAHVRILTGMGEEVSAMIGDDDSVEPGPEQFALSISVGQEMTPGAEYTFEFAMLDEDGEPVTVTQTARWTS